MTHTIFIASKQHKYKDKTGQSTSSPVHDNIALLKNNILLISYVLKYR